MEPRDKLRGNVPNAHEEQSRREGDHTISRRRYFGRVQREPQPRRNREIRLSPLKVIDHTNKLIGVVERDEALSMAEAAGLDLVEIQANQRPPLCKIMDFGKYKYEQSKKKSAQNKTNKANEVKEVRLGRSVKIDKHDVQLRVSQARKFLLDGHKVVIVQRFRGREMAHPQIGQERLVNIQKQLSDIANVVAPPSMSGRQMSMTLQPDKNKVETYKRKHAEEEEEKAPVEEVETEAATSEDIEAAAPEPDKATEAQP